jgi:CSLREA domain-containing protein
MEHGVRAGLAVVLTALGGAAAAAPGLVQAQTAITVTSAADTNDGVCDAADCTLREAIVEANDAPGAETIAFAIPGDGVRTITLSATLPRITETVTIDGYTQRGAKANTSRIGTNARLRIQIDVNDAGDGLFIDGDGSVVRGLVINNANDGIFVAADDVTIAGNFLGTDPTGTVADGNSDGVAINAGARLTVGGPKLADRNLIAGNEDDGVRVFATDSTVENNLVGTDRTGKAGLPNGEEGVTVGASDVVIQRNVVAFNAAEGIEVDDPSVDGVSILTNAVFANVGAAVVLAAGANDDIQPPVVETANRKRGRVAVRGTVEGPPNREILVQVFANADAEDAEGTRFLAERTVTTDGAGGAEVTARFSKKKAKRIRIGQGITMTATDVASGSSSAFSEPRTVNVPDV